jgi:FtsZ-interacting cell division protein ZipA
MKARIRIALGLIAVIAKYFWQLWSERKSGKG